MLIIILIALGVVILDQTSKLLVLNTMELYESKMLIKNFFYIFSTRNDGAAWSIQIPYVVLIIVTVLALGIFVYLSYKVVFKKQKWLSFTIGFMMGGTIGNFIDRLFYPDKLVVDFLSFILYYPSFKDGSLIWKQYFFPTFNIADSFLVVGVIMFIIYILFLDPSIKKNKKNKKINENEQS